MTKIEKLKESIVKAEAKVEKIKGTIARHEKALEKKITLLAKAGADLTGITDYRDLSSIKWTKSDDGETNKFYWEACEVESKADDIRGASRKLRDAEEVLENWKEKLRKEQDKDTFIQLNAPQVIIDFLNTWKDMAYDWHVKRCEAAIELKKELNKKVEAIKLECSEKGMYWREADKVLEEKKLDYKNVKNAIKREAGSPMVLTMMAMYEKERLTYLNTMLEQEKRAKLIDLITRVKEVVGEITDASYLDVSEKGNLDGFVYGTKGKAHVETIGAGGYNIVCFHYRTLVKPMK